MQIQEWLTCCYLLWLLIGLLSWKWMAQYCIILQDLLILVDAIYYSFLKHFTCRHIKVSKLCFWTTFRRWYYYEMFDGGINVLLSLRDWNETGASCHVAAVVEILILQSFHDLIQSESGGAPKWKGMWEMSFNGTNTGATGRYTEVSQQIGKY